MAATRSWVSAHVFYDGELDLVITDLLATVQSRLDEVAAGAELFFLRYWNGGPHVRIRVLATRLHTDDVRRIVSGAIVDFLRRAPAPARGSQADYDRYAPSKATREQVRSYELRRRPNNSFAFSPYRPETHKYGTGASLRAAEDHFVRCSAAVRRFLETRPSNEQRGAAAFAALAVNRWIASHGTGRPQSASVMWTPGGEAAAAARYENRRDTLLAISARMRALAANPPSEPSELAGALAASATTLAGRIEAPDAPRDVLDRCARLTCNRLGVSLTGESRLRDLSNRVFAELAGEEAVV
ncbi:lantibiotic dehydratase C-terminal domain-containing protein [Prauserella cavernicola]|uniref:Thiopeptide-type bacteriocin biosynthesis domain-containing protein n=1 Tax=Prauserella cavernicola TaxID=2800127 RepID=A0A934V7R6_9PSEU|nr:lantibiotic dehydratase C-terminal domain-containing protein [Prauserella cavernicola]MBK1787525.1 hypothetical protein [Prauserella cavernicola]